MSDLNRIEQLIQLEFVSLFEKYETKVKRLNLRIQTLERKLEHLEKRMEETKCQLKQETINPTR